MNYASRVSGGCNAVHVIEQHRSLTLHNPWVQIVASLTLLLMVPIRAVAESTTIFKDAGVHVEVSSDSAGQHLSLWNSKIRLVEITKRNQLGHQTVEMLLPSGETLLVPGELKDFKITFVVSNPKRQILKPLFLGESTYQFDCGAELTKHGYVKLLDSRVLLFPSGNLAIKTRQGTALLFIDGSTTVARLDELSSASAERLRSFWKAFERYSVSSPLDPISITNFSSREEPALRSMPSGGDKALQSNEFDAYGQKDSIECKELPPCCCAPDHKGPCYNWLVYVPGAGGGVSGSSESSSSGQSPWDPYPCHKNTYIFDGKGLPAEKQAKKLAELIKEAAATCGPQSRGVAEGYCFGGKTLWRALDDLGDAAKQLDVARFYSTPFSGASTATQILAGALSLGATFVLLSEGQLDAFAGGGEVGPTTTDVPIEIYIGEKDDYFSMDAQRGPINDPLLVFVDPEGGHFDTITRNRHFVTCCGDEVINGSETCEHEDEGKQCDNFAEEFTGVCRGCKCLPEDTANSCKCVAVDYDAPGREECIQRSSDLTLPPVCSDGFSLVKESQKDGALFCWCERSQIPSSSETGQPGETSGGSTRPEPGGATTRNPADALVVQGSSDEADSAASSIDSHQDGGQPLQDKRIEGWDF